MSRLTVPGSQRDPIRLLSQIKEEDITECNSFNEEEKQDVAVDNSNGTIILS